ncbi:hypothetical protein [Streptosporangium sp. NPDC006007]|uniref:hypothetical protein n=1 Tax=Streptosporangium sp. NPDC006007 TaxID=3154575 RepID=UPI0033A47D51
MLDTLILTLWLYGAGALAWLTGCALHIATTPRLTHRLFTPGARHLGMRPRSLIILATLGSSLLWPLTALLICANLLRRRP